jgi:hypothetical protein
VNDIILADCSCAGTFADADNDGICDANDNCAGQEAGTPCDDNNPCTVNDIILADCSCAGTFADADNDGTCDANDNCAGPEAGTSCDDGNEATINDIIQVNCTCQGEFMLEGCTDSLACNFDAAATINDGSCAYDSYADTTISFTDSLVWNGNVYYTPGVYTYIVTNTIGCDSIITLNLVLILNETSQEHNYNIEIFPIPALDFITFRYGSIALTPFHSIRIFNNIGSTIHDSVITKSEETFDVASWSAGIYQVVLYDEDGTAIGRRKIVIQ